ncbi:hypothetical protein CCB80_02125 [Armatimonadetes bacterium Uphvl-Ar1]|nr:hypothetical protein CCB80_02125 [Armatimonadetes bacterium Uphvl-Ar1]
MTPVPRNSEIPNQKAIDPILGWARSNISLPPIQIRNQDELESHLLTTALNNIISVRGQFKAVWELTRTLPNDLHVVIIPVTGTGLVHCHKSTKFLERDCAVIFSGRQNLKLAISTQPFQFLIATTLSSELTSLAHSRLINLLPGQAKLVLCSEVPSPSHHQPQINFKNDQTAPQKNAFLLNMLTATSPAASTQATFAPKIPPTLRQFHGLLQDIRQNPRQDWNLVECARTAHYSQFHFSRLFRSEFQMGFREFVTECRIRHAANLLCNSGLSTREIMEQTGFNSAFSFRNSLRNCLGFSRAELVQSTKKLQAL